MASRRSWYRQFYPTSTPRDVRGGIKAQSRRGRIGETWWAGRWIGVLEGFHIGSRLARGRSYARRGQVVNLKIAKGKITADVQGSRVKPYRVSIVLRRLSQAQWKKVVSRLSRNAAYAAKLLAGEMPRDMEQVFTDAGLSLFPRRLDDLETDCSCPDWSNPCKHIAAVYYLLGEAFDGDPFLLFKLRGLERSELLDALRGPATRAPAAGAGRKRAKAATAHARAGGKISAGARAAGGRAQEPPEPLPAAPLPTEPEAFWMGRAMPDDQGLFGSVEAPPVSAALARRLGSFPLWRGRRRFFDAIEPAYREGAKLGREVFIGSAGAWSPAGTASSTR